jgi:hypothetical protein
VDSILAGDAAAGFCYVTPAGGVVMVPMATLGLRDHEAGTVTLTTSLGLPKKLARLQRNPSVAISYHAREHGDSILPHHVLVQGVATVQAPDRTWLESITPHWEKLTTSEGPLPAGGRRAHLPHVPAAYGRARAARSHRLAERRR